MEINNLQHFGISCNTHRPALGPNQLPIPLSLEVKRPEREADHSPLFSAEVKNAWNYTSTPPIRLHSVVIVKHSYNSTFKIIKVRWCDIIPNVDKSNDTMDDCCVDVVCVLDYFAKNHVKILLGDFSTKVGRVWTFKPSEEIESLHEISDDEGVRIINFATKNLSGVKCSHIAAFINTFGLLRMGKRITK